MKPCRGNSRSRFCCAQRWSSIPSRACAGAAFLSLVAPWSLALSPAMGVGSALAFCAYGAIRYRDAGVILRYRRNIRRLPRYVMTSKDVPVSQQRLFVGARVSVGAETPIG